MKVREESKRWAGIKTQRVKIQKSRAIQCRSIEKESIGQKEEKELKVEYKEIKINTGAGNVNNRKLYLYIKKE